MKKIMFMLAPLLLSGLAFAQQNDPDSALGKNLRPEVGLEQLLSQVEQNNLTLAAARKLIDARTLQARTGNSLANPTVELERLWGSPSSLGKSGELTVSQGFDFPTVYAGRNRLAGINAGIYELEYEVTRKEVLLQAHQQLIEIDMLRREVLLLESMTIRAEDVERLFRLRLDSGDAGIIDVNRASFELLSVRSKLREAQADYATAVKRFSNLNGGQQIDLDNFTLGDTPALLPVDEIIAAYDVTSPELMMLSQEVVAADAGIKLSRSEALPGFQLGYRRDFGKGENFNGIVVGMSIPMFANRNNVKRAKAEQQHSRMQLDSRRVELLTQVEELYEYATIQATLVDELKKLLDGSQAAELLEKALQAGHISLPEYYSKADLILETHLSLNRAEGKYRAAVAGLYMVYL